MGDQSKIKFVNKQNKVREVVKGSREYNRLKLSKNWEIKKAPTT